MNTSSLYNVFSKYPDLPLRDADANDCSAGDGFAEKLYETLRGKPLASLSESELLDYYYLAVSHIGTVDDFKHYLPRILELMATTSKPLLSHQTLLEKLREAAFTSWSSDEQQAVITFCQDSPPTRKLAKLADEITTAVRDAAV